MIATLYYRHRPLAKLRIILRHDRNLLNQRVCADNPLDFLRLNAFSAAKKKIIHSSKDGQPAVVKPAPIAGGKPAIGVGERYRLAASPVACGHAVRSKPHFAIHDAQFAPRQRQPDIRQAIRFLGANSVSP